MPIVDVELVGDTTPGGAGGAAALADALGRVFQSPPGRTWVRLRRLDSGAYAENDVQLDAGELPVFVTVLQAQPPAGAALAEEVAAVTAAVAGCVGRPAERVHVRYLPPAAGRQAFGGRLVE